MKIAIIGAGSCGLYLASKLAKKAEVAVFEKKDKVGDKACSGLYSARLLDFVPSASQLAENEIKFAKIHFPKKTLTINFLKKFLVIDRDKLDKNLFELAVNNGAEVIFNKNIDEIPAGFDKIIGCDGADSYVRKFLKAKNPSYRMGIQGFVKNSGLKEDFVETWPCKNGFIWRIPRKNDIEYGIIANLSDAYKLFCDFAKKNNLNISQVKAKMIPLGFSLPKNEKITLCGDAIGLTKPWSGGGVVWGMIAANILADNFENFKKYRIKTKRFFLTKIIFYKFLVKVVYFLGFNFPFLLPSNISMESDFIIK